MTSTELPYVIIHYDAPIVYFRYKESVELGFPEIRQLITIAEKLSGGRPYVTLSDVRTEVNITEQGKKFVAASENMKLFRGTAALVKNSMMRIAANFLNNFDSQPYPFKAFTDEQAAIKWLLSLPLK